MFIKPLFKNNVLNLNKFYLKVMTHTETADMSSKALLRTYNTPGAVFQHFSSDFFARVPVESCDRAISFYLEIKTIQN